MLGSVDIVDLNIHTLSLRLCWIAESLSQISNNVKYFSVCPVVEVFGKDKKEFLVRQEEG